MILQISDYFLPLIVFILGLYCLIKKDNLIKIAIGLKFMTDGLHLFLITIGYKKGGLPPIGGAEGSIVKEGRITMLDKMVDPVPQVMTLTSIVISVCVLALFLALVVRNYNKYETLSLQKIWRCSP